MFGAVRKAASAALVTAALIAGSMAAPAFADSADKAAGRLRSVPVFFVADASGSPVQETAGAGPTYYLTRSQASLGLGMVRGERASAGRNPEGLHVAVTDLAAATRHPGEETFVKPVSTIDAAVALDGVPLFIIRDKDGSPFTVKDKDGKARILFYLSESDARDFIKRVIDETGRTWDDIRLSVISLDVIVNSMRTSRDPSVASWVIYPSAETRLDAANLSAEARLDTTQNLPR